MVLASGNPSISAQSLPTGSYCIPLKEVLWENTAIPIHHVAPVLGTICNCSVFINLYTAENLACRTGTLISNFLPQRSLGKWFLLSWAYWKNADEVKHKHTVLEFSWENIGEGFQHAWNASLHHSPSFSVLYSYTVQL